MANHKATKKDARQNEKRRERNKYYGKTMRNAYRKMLAAPKTEAEEMLPKVVAMLDKLAKRKIIHRNKAANLKSAAYKNIQAMA